MTRKPPKIFTAANIIARNPNKFEVSKILSLVLANAAIIAPTIITDDKLNISSLQTGFYMTKVTIDGRTSTSKLIIE